MSDSPYSCYCYSCCVLVFVLLLDCCCFPPKLSFIVRTRAAMCWFFWILFGYHPSANEGPSRMLKSWCQIHFCGKQRSRAVHTERAYTHVCAHADIPLNTRVRHSLCQCEHRTCALERRPTGGCGGCTLIKSLFTSACRKFSLIKGWREFLDVAMR